MLKNLRRSVWPPAPLLPDLMPQRHQPRQAQSQQAQALAGLPALQQAPLVLDPPLVTRLKPVYRDEDAAAQRSSGECSTSGREWQVSLPCRLRLACGPGGKPDLRLQLLDLRLGAPDPPAACAPPPLPPSLSRAADFGNRVAALLLARVMLPDAAPAAVQSLSYAGFAAVLARAVLAALPRAQRRRVRSSAARLARRLQRRAPLLLEGGRAAGAWLEEVGTPAAALVVAAALWSLVDPASFHVAKCLAAAIPVAAGYAQTTRDGACGRLPPGQALEEAWRRRHKWAAQRVAHLLTDLPASPPLAPLLQVAQTLSINAGLAVDGGGLACGAAGMPVSLALSLPLPSSRVPATRQHAPPPPADAPPAHSDVARRRQALAGLPLQTFVDSAVAQTRQSQGAAGGGPVVDAQDTVASQPVGGQAAPPALPLAATSGGDTGLAPSSGAGGGALTAELLASRQQVGVPSPDAAPGLPTFHLPTLVSYQELAAFNSALRAQQRGAGPASDASTHGSASLVPSAAPSAAPSVAVSVAASEAPSGSATPRAAAVSGARGRSVVDSPSEVAALCARLRSQQASRPQVSFADEKAPGAGGSKPTAASREIVPDEPVPHLHAASQLDHGPVGKPLGRPAPGLAAAGAGRGRPAVRELPDGSVLLQVDATGDDRLLGTAPGQRPPVAALVTPSLAAGAPAGGAGGAAAGRAAGEEGEEGLALYGRADHLAGPPLPLTWAERRQLALRAAYLLAVFAPFLLLGPPLLLAALALQPRAELMPAAQQLPAQAVAQAQAAGAPGPGARRVGSSVEEEAAAGGWGRPSAPGRLREAATAAAAQPLPLVVPVNGPESALGGAAGSLRRAAFRLLLAGIRASGAAFIKWGQWSATREDMFPQDFCRILSELHDRAPTHTWEESRAAIEAAFGRPVEELLESIEHDALASGSIAQVHRGWMVVEGVRRRVVVKVAHPRVAHRIHQDFQLLKPLAAATARVRALKGLNLKESVVQFSHTMTAQADLRVEAAHLRRFYDNFAAVRASVTPPYPLPGYVTPEVLIETYEPGDSVAKYIRTPTPFNTQIVALGVDTYLKMLLQDNFVHTDLHPGNILVRVRGADHVPEAAGALSEEAAARVRKQLQLVLLDFGLAEELTPPVRFHFISFLHCIAKGDGARGGQHMLAMGTPQECPSPAAFCQDMVLLFARECNIHSAAGIDVDRVLKAALGLARKHEVSIDSSYAALVVGVCVIVGFATALDPRVNLIDAAAPCFLIHQLTGLVHGRLYA